MLLQGMRAGEFDDGQHILRASIDMASPNMNMRDPTLYRIRKVYHHRTGDEWCIYPMYDFAHPLSDAIEGVTHSLCSMEYEDHRPLYDWFLEELGVFRSRQIEFARLNISYTMLHKRSRLVELVDSGFVTGWDDPRMPTLAGPQEERLYAGRHPRVLPPGGHREDQQPHGCRASGALRQG